MIYVKTMLTLYQTALTKLKAFTNDTFSVAKTTIPVFDTGENIVGKGENDGYQHFLLFPQSFRNASNTGLLKYVIVW